MKWRFWLLVVLLVLLISGCGETDTPVQPTMPTVQPTPSPPQPTAPASVEPTRAIGEPTVEPSAPSTTAVIVQPTMGPTEAPTVRAIPPTVTPKPKPIVGLDPGWYMYSNANHVQDVAFSDGVVWAATRGGVVRWDPFDQEATKYTVLNGPNHNVVNAVVVCLVPDLRIVFGTLAGLSLYDPVTGKWAFMTSANSALLDDSVISLGCAWDSRTLLIGYGSRGLHTFNSITDEWRYYNTNNGLGDNIVSAIGLVGNMEQIWTAGPTGGVSVITNAGITVYTEDNSDIPDDNIVKILADAAGNVWLGPFISTQLIRFHDGNWTVYDKDNTESFPSFGGIHGLAFAPDGAIWVGTSSSDLCKFDRVGETCQALYKGEAGMAPRLTALATDFLGNVFYGSDEEGISVFDGDTWKNLSLDGDQLAQNEIQALGQDHDGRIWVGTLSGGAQRFDPADPEARWEAFPDIPNLSVHTFHTDPWGGFWIGHGSGASYYDGARWTHFVKDDGILPSVRAIAVDNLGKTWFGTSEGISIWDGQSFTTLSSDDGLPDDNVRALLADGAVVWVGTHNGGLMRFENDEFTVLDQTSGLPGNLVSALARDVDGKLLVGADRDLILVDERGQVVSLFRTESVFGLITSIAVGTDATIWLGTLADGAYYMDGSDWNHFTTADGLPSSRFSPGSVVMDYLDTIWLGGMEGGLVRYVP